MASIEQLPSGAYRATVSHQGRRHRVTAPTLDECKLRAAELRVELGIGPRRLTGTVDDLLRNRVVALQMLADSPLLDEQRLASFHRRAQVFRERLGSELLMADGHGHMLLHTGVPFGQPLPPMPRPAGRAALPQALAEARFAAGFSSHHALLLKTMALKGRGLAWLPRSLIQEELRAGQLLIVGAPRWQIPIQIRLYRQSADMTPIAEQLWALASRPPPTATPEPSTTDRP